VRTPGPVCAAARLSDEIFVLVGRSGAPPAEGGWRSCAPRGGPGWIAAAHEPAGELVSERVLVDLRTLLREHLASWDREARAAAVSFLGSLCAAGGPPSSLSEGLHLAREVLRERLPLSVEHPDAAPAVHVERLHRIGAREFYVRGWFAHEPAVPVARLTAVSPEGARAELSDRAFRFPGPPSRSGFIAYFEIDWPSALRDGWVVEIEDSSGRSCETWAPAAVEDAAATQSLVVSDLELEPVGSRELRARHTGPALGRFAALRWETVEIARIDQLGPAPSSPPVSILVPLSARIDLLEHQLARWARDPELRRAELTYVLDSPEPAAELRPLATQLYDLYGLPFRIIALSATSGFALACNLVASVACAPLLLLLDPAVLPAARGWVGRMCEFYDATPHIGALGPKLLHEDEAVRHAGLDFERVPDEQEWSIDRRFHGLHRASPVANVAEPVPALGGACFMTGAAVFKRLGGLCTAYLQRDYAVADYCLRLREEGRDSWYLSHVELYHVGDGSPRSRALSRHDGWLLSKHSATIERPSTGLREGVRARRPPAGSRDDLPLVVTQ
jgi:GT2 family glycosyltransferase